MECQSCAKKFNGLTVIPQHIQPCQHTICLECLSALSDGNCPICHHLIASSNLNQSVIDEINSQASINHSLDRRLSDSSFGTTSSTSSFPIVQLDNIQNEKIMHNIDEKFRFKNEKATSLFQPGRFFVLEGVFLKECKKKAKIRIFFLFNDILVYGKHWRMNSNKLVSQHILSLNGMQVKPFLSNDLKLQNLGMFIMTPKKSFKVYANTSQEKTEWLTKLQQCISMLQIENVINSQESTMLAPIWTPDFEASNCKRCSTKFNFINRRHHCRMCGYVVCDDCSDTRLIMTNICKDEPVRVCHECHKDHAANVKQQMRKKSSRNDVYNNEIILKHTFPV